MTSLVGCISDSLCLDESYVASIIRRSACYYKKYTIPKRDGSPREIVQASPELKSLQYWVIQNILIHFPVSESAFAYKHGDSVKRHAEYHKDSYFIYHSDVKKFFPSISAKQLIEKLEMHKQIIEDAGFWYEDTCEIISKICFRYDHLCIGTVSSPMISNIIMYDFDEYFRDYCKEKRYKYSRYADDIYISSNAYIPNSISSIIVGKLSNLGFQINIEKTWFKSIKSQRRVTGLVITDRGRVSVGNDRRQAIKKMIYDRIIHGKGESEVILGYLAFLKDVEPATYNRFLIKYATYCDGDVIAAIKSGPNPKPFSSVLFDLPNI